MLANLSSTRAWDSWFSGQMQHAYDDWLPNSTVCILKHAAKTLNDLRTGTGEVRPGNRNGTNESPTVLHVGCGTSALSPCLASLRQVGRLINIDSSGKGISGAKVLFERSQQAASKKGIVFCPTGFAKGSMQELERCVQGFNIGSEPVVIVDKCGIDAIALGQPPTGGERAAAQLLREGPLRLLRGRSGAGMFLHYTDEDPELREPLLRRAGFRRVRWTSLGIPRAPEPQLEPADGPLRPAGGISQCQQAEVAVEGVAVPRPSPLHEDYDSSGSVSEEEAAADLLQHLNWAAPATADGHMASASGSQLVDSSGGRALHLLLDATGVAQVGQTGTAGALRREVFAYVALA